MKYLFGVDLVNELRDPKYQKFLDPASEDNIQTDASGNVIETTIDDVLNTCNIDRIIEDIRNKNLWEVSRELFKLITLIPKSKKKSYTLSDITLYTFYL